MPGIINIRNLEMDRHGKAPRDHEGTSRGDASMSRGTPDCHQKGRSEGRGMGSTFLTSLRRN